MKTLETERLILRDWTIEDLDDFYEYARTPNVGPNAGWEPHSSKDVSLNILRDFIEKDECRAIVLKSSGKVIGSLGIHSDNNRKYDVAKSLGYVLSEDYWGKGLMTEAAKCAIRHVFTDVDVDVLSVYHSSNNVRSRRVIEKCGFKFEGTLRHARKINGNIYDTLCYSILKSEYQPK